MLKVGINPHGIGYHLGLRGAGSPRANPNGKGLAGLVDLSEEVGALTIEFQEQWITGMAERDVEALRKRLASRGMTPVISGAMLAADSADGGVRACKAIGAKVIRVPLTRVPCGDRHVLGDEWPRLVATVRAQLAPFAQAAAAEGLTLALENHQDFTSVELMALCEEMGDNVGICFDTGNALAVAEDPLTFARRIVTRIRHVHIKDYRAQMTDEGYRLVTCAIGEGLLQFDAIADIIRMHHKSMTATIEPAPLDARHIRVFTAAWWQGYPPRSATELAACLAATRRNRLPEGADYRTPWERGEDDKVAAYELDVIRRSVAHMEATGFMGQKVNV